MDDAEPSLRDSWTLALGDIDGHRVICRWKNGVTAPDEARPIKVTVRLGFTDPRSDGMPGPRDCDELETIEEQLILEMAEYGAELVLVITGNSTREFIAYCVSHDWLNVWGPTVTARWSVGRPRTGLDAVTEPDWRTFRAFTRAT